MAVKKGGLGKGLDSLIPSTGGPKNKKSNTVIEDLSLIHI